MHIEPGVLNAAKILAANAGAVAVLAAHAPGLIRRPGEIVKFLLAAAFFSLFMEIYHLPVGPSELHFIGASAVYFLFGFLPTLFGFAFGLLLQGALFEPQDLIHLGVNSLSLIVPLVAVHAAMGRRFFAEGADKREVNWKRIAAFDAAYYAGVTGMVGFWLLLGEETTPLADWATFAAYYAPLVLLEPVFTWAALKGVNSLRQDGAIRRLTVVDQLALA
jgi:cobalt/nickel transport system permease protein